MSKKKKQQPAGKKQPKVKPVRFADVIRSPLIRFLGIFAAIMIVFYIIWFTDFFKEHIVYPWNGINAAISSFILSIFGQGTYAKDMMIHGGDISISIKEGCDAIEPAMLFSAAVIAFPSPWKKKLKGIGYGLVILFTLNIFRIVTLFLTEKFWPAAFDFMHIQFWQIAFIIAAIVLWILWMRTTTNTAHGEVQG